MKNPLTSAGILWAIFRFVAQLLSHCVTAVPSLNTMVTLNKSKVNHLIKRIFPAQVRTDILLGGNKKPKAIKCRQHRTSQSRSARHCTHRMIHSVFHTPHLGNPWDASVRVAAVPSHQNRTLLWFRSDKLIPGSKRPFHHDVWKLGKAKQK